LIQKHPKLVWQTLCLASHESKKTHFHEWIPLKKQKNKKEEFLAELFPNMKMSDVVTLAQITSDKEIKAYCESLGWDKKQVNAIKF
jgi:L-rhamnose isomerase